MHGKMGGAEMKVYHGGTDIVKHPNCLYGRENLDFGRGFYITDIRSQAVSWAERTALKRNMKPLLNIYSLDKQQILLTARCKIFTAYDEDWLDFIVDSRLGKNPAMEYDYVEGGVANDRVVDTINIYMSGLMDKDIALQRLKLHVPNNQICLLNQEIIDKYLVYERTESI